MAVAARPFSSVADHSAAPAATRQRMTTSTPHPTTPVPAQCQWPSAIGQPLRVGGSEAVGGDWPGAMHRAD